MIAPSRQWDSKRGDPYVALARLSLETFVETGFPPDLPDDLPSEILHGRAGVFVSLHERGRLRGCIGTVAPMRACIGDEIICNAVAACSEDPRFIPVSVDELPLIDCSVDVLRPSEPIASPAALDPGRYGIIVRNGSRQGLLLPDIEGVETPEEQLAIARRKAGIASCEPVEIARFEVVRHV